MKMGYLFLLTFSGSALFVGYLCWERILGKYVTQSMRYIAVVIVMLTYLIPWIWVKEIYRHILLRLWYEKLTEYAKGWVNFVDIQTKENAYRTEDYQLLTIVTVIWFVVAMFIMLLKVFRYLNKRHSLCSLSIECGDKNLKDAMNRLQKEIRCRPFPEIVWTRVDNKTFTLGALRPIIFLQKKYAEGELYWILKHELTHIARRDLLFKMLMELASCFHWFNPLIYLLERKLEFVCEASCDERVLKGCTDKERNAYIKLLDDNKNDKRLEIPFCSALKNGDENINERIRLLEEKRKIKCQKKAFAMSTFTLLILLDSLIVFAYPKVQHVKDAVVEVAEDAVGGENFWAYDYIEGGYGAPVDTILYDEQFIDEAGQIYPVHVDGTNPSCLEHDIVSGYYQVHNRNDDGSCTVKTYESTKCTICDMIWVGEFYSENTQMTCGH